MIFKNAHSIHIRQERCFNQRHQMRLCDHCVSACPMGAISLDGVDLHLNRDQCGGCGLCLSDCPTQVFHSGQWDETTIVETIKREKWKTVELFCGKHTAPFRNKASGQGAIRIPACLSAISRGAWYEMGSQAEIWIHMDQCHDCPFSQTNNRLVYNTEVAIEWLESSGYQPKFKTILHDQGNKKRKSLRATDKGLRVTSRRDLILLPIGKGTAERAITKRDRKELIGNTVGLRGENLLPQWHKRLAGVYHQGRKEAVTPTYWPTIRKSKTCINCGTCAAICPTQTLQINASSRKCEHTFTSGFCLDCRLCQTFCPVEAITRNREKTERPFEQWLILSSKTTHCNHCDRPVFNPSLEQCYWCAEEESNDIDLKESCRNLFLNL